MTRDLSYYLNKVPPLNLNKPDYIATLSLLLQPLVDCQAFIASIPLEFDLDTAIGVQLDVCGQWLNQSRKIPVPIADPWFALDDAIRCLDRAPWQIDGVGSGNTYVSLDDDTYRRLLYATRAANYWDGTAAGAQEALWVFFQGASNISSGAIGIGAIGEMTIGGDDPPPNGTLVFVEDKCDMSMTIGVSGVVPPIVDLEILAQDLIRVKPQGVELDVTVTSISGTPLFGFDVSSSLIGGFDVGSLGVTPDYAAQHIT